MGNTKSNTRNRGYTGNSRDNIIKVNGHIGSTKCNTGASQSAADGILFPLQYNGETYNEHTFKTELFFIPFKQENPNNLAKKYNEYFKCGGKKLSNEHGCAALLIHGNPRNIPKYFMILFHGNGVDLGIASVMWRPLIRSLPIHMLIVEYPGYGIMDGRCTCDNVLYIAKHVYSFVTNSKTNRGLGIDPNKLIILGRSIGTGPASYLAKFPCNTLILVSPFTSIHDIGKDLVGTWASIFLVKDYDDNDTNNNDNNNNNNINSMDINKSMPPPIFHQITKSQSDISWKNRDKNGVTGIKKFIPPKTQITIEQSTNDLTGDNLDMDDDLGFINSINGDNVLNKSLELNDDDEYNRIHKPSITPFDDSKYPDQVDDDELNSNNNNNITSHNNLGPKSFGSRIIRSETTQVTRKKNNRTANKKSTFVFNNKKQINNWQCKNVIIFHGKKDELISHKHSIELKNEIRSRFGDKINFKLFLIPNVGHNDVSTSYIALRVFTQFNEMEMNNNNNNNCNDNMYEQPLIIDHIVKYVECPPYYNIETNEVMSAKYSKIIDDDVDITNGNNKVIIKSNTQLELPTKNSHKNSFHSSKTAPNTALYNNNNNSNDSSDTIPIPGNIKNRKSSAPIPTKKKVKYNKPFDDSIYIIDNNEDIWNTSLSRNKWHPYKITRISDLFKKNKSKVLKEQHKQVGHIMHKSLPKTGLL